MPEVATPKYKQIANDLRRTIRDGGIRPGHVLPSQNELVAKYGVATGTVRQALMSLTSEGWVEPRKGRGVFVRPAASRRGNGENAKMSREHNVGYAMFGPYSAIEPEAQQTLHGSMAVFQEVGRRLMFRIFPDEKAVEAGLADLLDSVSGLIIARDISPSVISTLKQSAVRVVLLDYRPEDPHEMVFSHVICEAEASGHLAAQQLLMRYHRRLAVYTTKNEHNDYVRHTLAGVQRACLEYQAAPPTLFAATDREGERVAVKTIADEPRTTGIVAIDDLSACRLIHDLRVRGVRVPEDKSVVSIGGLPLEMLSETNMARVNRDYFKMGGEAARALLRPEHTVTRSSLGVRFEAGRTVRLLQEAELQ